MESKQIQPINKWLIYPDALNSKAFGGFNSRDDITEMRGYFPIGQNIIFTDGGKPTLRQGTELIGTLIDAVTPIMRAWRFERQDGVQIEMRTYDTKVEYWIDGISTNWALLKGGFTAGLKFTFCVISKSSNINSYVYFCNGIDPWYKWTGAYSTLSAFDDTAHTLTIQGTAPAPYAVGTYANSAVATYASNDGVNKITVNGAVALADLGFPATGSFTLKGATITYTSLTAETFNGCSSIPGGLAGNEPIAIVDITKATAFIINEVSIYDLGFPTSGNLNILGKTVTYTNISGNRFYGTSTLPAGMVAGASVVQLESKDALGFNASGTIIINGLELTYTGASNQTFTGVSSMAALTAVAGDILVQSPTDASLIDFKSSVAFVDNGRIHARLETKQAVSNYSKLDNPDDWTAGSSDGDGGAKFIEQGGSIVAYAHDESKLFIFKKRLIKTLEFVQAGDRVDIPKYATYKPSDDKSTTVGALGDKSTFHAPNGILFVTEDKELLYLKRQEYIDYPQQISISDIIRPTFQQGVHDDASGIVWKSKVYYAFKQDTNSAANDVVVIYDLIRNRWFMPIVGWNVNDWTIIQNELHWHSSISPNSYKLIDSNRTDLGLNFTTILRSHAENFDMYKSPQEQAVVSDIMLEIYMTENAVINFDIFYDEDGYTEIDSAVLRGTDQANLVNSTTYNPFGANPFGYEQFGSNATVSGMKKYRYQIPLKGNNEVYNMSVSLSTQDAGVNYELIRYGYFVKEVIKRPNNKIIFNIAK